MIHLYLLEYIPFDGIIAYFPFGGGKYFIPDLGCETDTCQ
jgi:hypothetical protein